MNAFKKFWHVAAESDRLGTTPLRVIVLGEQIALWRGRSGQPVAVADRCLHRSARLSSGRTSDGVLQCRYHGWCYDDSGRVCRIPAEEGRNLSGPLLRTPPFLTREQDGYVYVRLDSLAEGTDEFPPFRMPHWQEPGWRHVRLVNRFAGGVADCIENFIDVPHTAFVHDRVFRRSIGETIRARVVRAAGRVTVTYDGERSNLGAWSWFLNPKGAPVEHEDNYFCPNITCVRYRLKNGYGFVITSQSVPIDECTTLVYTDLAYRFGMFTALAGPFVRRAGQRVIDQDLSIIEEQGKIVAEHGRRFCFSTPDMIHRCVDEIRDAIERGDDPRLLPEQMFEIEFRV